MVIVYYIPRSKQVSDKKHSKRSEQKLDLSPCNYYPPPIKELIYIKGPRMTFYDLEHRC